MMQEVHGTEDVGKSKLESAKETLKSINPFVKVEGFDTAQVARLMDKRAGTIRALQLRALQSLRRELERQGERGSA